MFSIWSIYGKCVSQFLEEIILLRLDYFFLYCFIVVLVPPIIRRTNPWSYPCTSKNGPPRKKRAWKSRKGNSTFRNHYSIFGLRIICITLILKKKFGFVINIWLWTLLKYIWFSAHQTTLKKTFIKVWIWHIRDLTRSF